MGSLNNPSLPFVLTKLADETVNNSNVTQDDDELQGVALVSGKTYRIIVLINYTSSVGADFLAKLVFSQDVIFAGYLHYMNTAMTASSLNHQSTGTTATAETAMGGNGANIISAVWNLIVQPVSTSGTVKLQWAQNTAEASNTVVKAGSKIILETLA